MMVTGTVVCETDTPEDYNQIIVSLHGRAQVHISRRRNSSRRNSRTGRTNTEIVHYSSNEDYINCSTVLWDKSTNGQEGKFPVGAYRFNFSFQLTGANLPASYRGTVGSIEYILEAKVEKSSFFKQDITG